MHGWNGAICLLLAMLLSGCPGNGKDAGSGDAAAGSQADPATDDRPVAEKAEQSGLARDEIAAIWDSLTGEERMMLEDYGWSLEEIQEMYAGDPPEELERRLADDLDWQRQQDFHSPGVWGELRIIWKEIDRSGPEYEQGVDTIAGNFDADPETELLAQTAESSYLLEADGSRRELTLPGWGQMKVGSTWDCDGDGQTELVCSVYSRDSGGSHGVPQLRVVGLQGNIACRIDGGLPMAAQFTGDLDGDGFRELVYRPPGGGLAAAGRQGQLIWQSTDTRGEMLQGIGDMDGDGLDELLCIAGPDGPAALLDRFCLLGWQQTAEAAQHTALQDPRAFPMACADLDGDGRAEVILTDSFANLADGSETQLEKPVDWSTFSFGSFPGVVFALEVRETGRLLMGRVGEKHGSQRFDTLLAWDAQGQLRYQEHFDNGITELHVLQQGSSDRLVLRLGGEIHATGF